MWEEREAEMVLESESTVAALKLLFFGAVIFLGLLLLFIVRRIMGAVTETLEAVIARYDKRTARRRLDKRFARGEISLERYRELRQGVERRGR